MLDSFENMVLRETVNERDDLVVTAIVSEKDLNKYLSSVDGDEVSDEDDVETEVEKYNMEMIFDAESEELKQLKYTLNEGDITFSDKVFDEYSMIMIYESWNNELGLEIPESVKDNSKKAPLEEEVTEEETEESTEQTEENIEDAIGEGVAA